MRKLQREGKARYIGITGYSLKNLVAIASRAKVDSILSYCRYNLMIGDMADVLLPFAKEHGVGVINASALHMGILTERGAPDWHPAPDEIREAGKKIIELCKAHGIDGSEVALKFCFGHQDVASTFVGMATRHHVDANLKALKARNNAAILEEIRALVAPVYNYVWPSGRKGNHG